jgi:hypothetical protein
MTLTIAQHAAPVDDSHWTWSVWLEGSPAELDTVSEVVWKLHPTFSPSVYRLKSRAKKFKLNAGGWGEFMIYAEVETKDGRSTSLEHWLKLEEDVATGIPSGTIVPTKAGAPVSEHGKGSWPTVFLSYSLDNANLAAHVAKALTKRKYSVTRDVDIPAGEEVLRWSKDQIAKSDAVLLLGADEAGISQGREVQIAQSAGIPVIPVAIGSSSKSPPPAMKEVQSIRVSGGSPQKIASNLVQQIDKLLL